MIDWTPAVAVLPDAGAGAGQVLSHGTTLVAENYSGGAVALNGVAFAAGSSTIAEGLGASVGGVYQVANDMAPLLGVGVSDADSGLTGFRILLNGLVPGARYTIQLFGGDDRETMGNPVELDDGKRSFRFPWGFPQLQDRGSFIVGTFVADDFTQTVRVRRVPGAAGGSGGGALLSGINVRQEDAPVLVTVRGQTSWDDSELVVDLVADVATDPLRSFGVRVEYDAARLSLVSAARDAAWYAGRPGAPITYAAPAIGPGSVVLLGTLLDFEDPGRGMGGAGAPLAQLRFQPLAALGSPITLALARPGTFANFVTVEEVVLDDGSVAFEDVGGGDVDTDGILGAFDRCPLAADPLDVDSGGVYAPGDPDGDALDGVGDVCQCGNLDDDGRANATDVDLLRGHLAGQPGAIALDRCAVVGPAPACDLRSWVVLARAGLGLPPGVMQVCTAAVGGGS